MSDLYSNDKIREQAELIVRNNVYFCFSQIVSRAAETEDGYKVFGLDDEQEFYNMCGRTIYVCTECDDEFLSEEDCQDHIDEEHEGDSTIDERQEEIYEHWAVSNWLGSKLREQGENVTDTNVGMIWGRACTGQAIAMDGNILVLAKEFLEKFPD